MVLAKTNKTYISIQRLTLEYTGIHMPKDLDYFNGNSNARRVIDPDSSKITCRSWAPVYDTPSHP